MDYYDKRKCHAIIHAAALLAVQTTMIISPGKVFEVSVAEAMAKQMIAQFLGCTVGKTVANILTGWLPGIGNAINATTVAGITEAIGWAAANEFDEGI